MQGSPRIDELRQKFHENPRRYFAPLANEYRKAGDPEQAIAICRAHLAQQPGHMSGHVVYGQALYDAKRPDEARVVFEKALTLDPDNAIVLRQLGDIAREKGDNPEARHWYSRALDVDPGDREVAAYIAELTEPTVDEAAESVAEVAPEAEQTVPETGMPVEDAAAGSPVPDEPEPEDGSPVLPSEPDAPPAHEDSPFVTRTMAELYASQGYRDAALDVYRQLALHHPDDREIMDRIEELSKEPVADAQVAAAEPAVETEHDSTTPAEHHLTDDAFTFQELDNELTPPPTDEDLNLVAPAEKTPESGKHFTELELDTAGDSWDSDAWAAGFSSDEGIDLEFDTPDLKLDTPTQPDVPDVIENPAQAETALDAAGAEPVEESSAPDEAVAARPVEEEPAPVVEEIPQAIEEAPPVAEAAPTPVEEPAPQEEAEPIVAYSPELPENEELPHYAPKGPTVREFFATLGAKKPPTHQPITARAVVPEIKPQENDELPLATDAFANMFADEPVNEEDARAAFALSGALAASETPASRAPTPPKPVPAQEAAPPAVPATTEESEEDIRRFREWLDGLSES